MCHATMYPYIMITLKLKADCMSSSFHSLIARYFSICIFIFVYVYIYVWIYHVQAGIVIRHTLLVWHLYYMTRYQDR